jgi:signal transduction histidine kinase/DNA-binding response OmpR family regulator
MTDGQEAYILIADDLEKNVLVYQSVLEELGQNLIAVRSGAEALKEVLRHDFAVILLDVNMPDMDGLETARFIRQRKRSVHTPIIFLTAFADEVRVAQGYAHGAVDYILTPVVPEILRAKVKVFVELFRMRLQIARQAEEQAKRAAAEASASRSAFLAEASSALSSSLDFEATLRHLAYLAVPSLADLSIVCLADERRQPGPLEWAWSDPARGSTVQPLTIRPRPSAWLADLLERVLQSGKSEILDPIEPTVAAAEPAGPAERAASAFPSIPAFVLQSVLALPLAARGRTLGAFVLALGPSGRHFHTEDVALADDLTDRAGIALDNALLVRDIQENDQRKNEFLAMLAHELRNPLAAICNAIHILRLHGSNQPDLVWAQEVIDRQVKHLVRLVDDLMDVSRITRGKIKLQLELLDTSKVIANAVETSRHLIEAHKHELIVSAPPEPISLNADPARMSQILANLLNNAAKYTPDRGRIWLSVMPEDGEITFRVRDTGTGIPREMLTKVFDLFTQMDRSLERSHGGLGIGLTLVQRLVELHGGTVQAFSEGLGQGSEFVVRLPVKAGEGSLDSGGSVKNPSREGATQARSRVLVADDNVDAAASLAVFLRLAGHEVRLSHDGLDALLAAQAFHADVVLLDIGLPGLDGYEVARRLRAHPDTKGVLLIAVSGYGQEEDRRRCFQAGFDHHFIKPVDWSALQKVFLPNKARAAASAAQ